MTGSAFTNYLTTYLEASQSISNGTFSLRSPGIPQTNYAITAGDAMKYMNINSLPITSNQCPTWGQIYTSRPTITPIYIIASAYSEEGTDYQYDITISIIGSDYFVDTDVSAYVYINSTTLEGKPVTSTQYLTIQNGARISPVTVLYPLYGSVTVNLGSISPLSSIDQQYLNGQYGNGA